MFFESSTHLPPNMNYGIRKPVESGGILVEDGKSIFHTAKCCPRVCYEPWWKNGGKMAKSKNDIYQVNLVYK